MTGGDDDVTWPAAAFAKQMQEASEDAMEQQQELFRRWLSASAEGDPTEDLSEYAATSVETATFKTRVQSGGRISIPDVEREVLGIEEGDIVQAIVLPVNPPNGD
ncbi:MULTISPECIES: AbrB/MazE/SpoVT family DNA-binding domain-containing protein [Halorussus]|uniref:AbrB/MazE/SpoVT family DNA-binding domain-containing protein n=1 Tax=Halorussus TaxID=1070314 RepID=UPI0020A1123B|nr:AbrB/MazE/SpoVT family DNA-binding domain-containing protein [Halorussus vallis]USZ75304.1 AbrB/MazE/SpoVT family DNA-binding domain-containing protein [Halorussus vallis]